MYEGRTGTNPVKHGFALVNQKLHSPNTKTHIKMYTRSRRGAANKLSSNTFFKKLSKRVKTHSI